MSPLPPDEWARQRRLEWMWAETVQDAYRRGREDEGDEHYQAEWDKKHRADAGKPTAAEQASIDAMKGRMR